MSRTISLQKGFNELVARANIPRVGQLVKVCKSQGMGMQSIINKMHDALNDRYQCNVGRCFSQISSCFTNL